MICAQCKTENPDGLKFCNECGAAFKASCASCGFENAPAAKFCGNCGSPIGGVRAAATKQSGSSPIRLAETVNTDATDGERKLVTALFADIKGSTELMEELDPEEARAIVDPALKLMIDAVHRYDGYIVQSTGDGIFALFGAPLAHEDHPQRAIYAALRMQEDLRHYSAKVVSQGGTPVQARIGANTGESVVRELETGHGHAEYAPIGHSTNLAARMQTAAPVGSIAVTEATRRLCEGFFKLNALGATKVKGVADPVPIYEVIGLGPLRTRLQVAERRGLTRFVGRNMELAQMRNALEAVRQAHGQIVAVMGEPGVGKSRLFFEFKAIAQSGCLILEAYSVSHGRASAYLPVIELLRDYFRIIPEDDPRQRRQKVIGRVLELDRSLESILPYLFTLLGIQEGEDPLARMDAKIRRQRTQDALKRIFIRESLNQPLIMAFEDLHWIDSDTQAFLNLLADSIANARILMLVNYRPEYRHEWGQRTHYAQLRLDPLGKESADEMLDALLSMPLARSVAGEGKRGDKPRAGEGADLATLKRFILDRTQGNPFFIEEIVQVLFDDGVLMRDGTVSTVLRPQSLLHIPPTVQGVLAARIDRLPAEEKELLQTLAVIGREFPLALIRRAAPKFTASLDAMLSDLQRAEFIYEQPAFPDVEYIFKHALTQEVAFNSLLVERRKVLDEEIAGAIEALFAEHLDDHLKDLALHYSRSSNTVKAIEYVRRAGEQAASRGFFEEAINQLETALGLLPKLENASVRDGQELAIRMALMMPLGNVNEIAAPANQQNVSRARLLCEQLGQSEFLAPILNFQFFMHWFVKNFALARECTEQLEDLAARTSNQITCFLARFTSGVLSSTTGDHVSARDYYERAMHLGDDTRRALINDPNTAVAFVNCIGQLGWSLWMLGYPEQARKQYERVIDLLGAPLDVFSRSNGMAYEILMFDFMRDSRRMLEAAERLVALARASGISMILGIGMIYMGRAMAAEGSVDRGIEAVAEGRDILLRLGNLVNLDLHEHLAATAYLEAGRSEEGLAIVEGAIEKCVAGGVRSREAELYRLRGELLLADDAPMTDAEDSFRKAITIAQRQQAKSWELRANAQPYAVTHEAGPS
jgi:class 3 adenylate cyclase/tetratricopeptide (TPR) repeat protein